MAYPSTLTTFTDPNATDKLSSPSHSSIETAQNTALEELQTYIGVTTGVSASALGTILYDIKAPDSDGGGHVQTANKGGTGHTSYTKGDVLVAQSTSVLTKLAVGGDGLNLVADSTTNAGVKWGAPGVLNVQSFLSSGSWSKPGGATNISKVFVELWGGGGSGASGTGTLSMGGGGGGGYNSAWFIASVLTSVVQVVVGAGGAGVAVNTGNGGGVTVFGGSVSMLSAFGGGGGSRNASGGGGGGGGGIFSAGTASGDDKGGVPGSPGFPFAGRGGDTNTAGSVATGGAGGGGDGAAGGNAVYGGAGGGGARSSVVGAGGISGIGGNGGAGGVVTGVAGSVPGGGGGAAAQNGTSGAGGGGKVIVTTFL